MTQRSESCLLFFMELHLSHEIQRSEKCPLSHIHTHIHPCACTCTHTQIAGGVSCSEWASDTPLGPLPRCQLGPPCSPDLVPAQRTEKQLPRLGCGSSLSCILGVLPPPEHLGGARDQGNSWAPTSERKRNRRSPHLRHLLWGPNHRPVPAGSTGAEWSADSLPGSGHSTASGRATTLDTPGASDSLGYRKWFGCSGHRFSSDPQPGSRNALQNLPTRLLFYTETLTQRRHQAEILPQNGVGWQVTSASIRFQEAPPHHRVLETECTSYRQPLLPSRCHGHCLDSLGLQPTFPAPSECPRPNCRRRTVEMWVAGRPLLWRSGGAKRVSGPLPGTTDLTAPSALTSVLLRDIRDFKRCEISPLSEDMPVRICLGWTWEAVPSMWENTLDEEGEMLTLPDTSVGGRWAIICIFWVCFEDFHNGNLNV